MRRPLLFAALLLPIACQTSPPGGDNAQEIRVVRLEHAMAGSVAAGLRADGEAGLRVAVQESTNSVIVCGSAARIEAALATIARLDVPGDAGR